MDSANGAITGTIGGLFQHSPSQGELTWRDRAELIEDTRWCRNFEWPEIEILAQHMTVRRVPRGRVVFREGSHEAYMGLVVAGRVRIVKADSDERRRVIHTIGPGRTLGEMSLIDGEPRSATAEAVDDATLLVLTRDGFDELTTRYPALVVRLLTQIAKLLSQRLRRTSGILVEHLDD